MKKLLLLSMLLLSAFSIVKADETKEITLTYDKEQFSFVENNSREVTVVPVSGVAAYSEEENSLGIPFFACNVLVSGNSSYKSVAFSYEKEKLRDNCTLAEAPRQYTTDMYGNVVEPVVTSSTKTISQNVFVKYVGESKSGDYKILHFNVCPFEYDSTNGQLFLANKIDVKINLHDSGVAKLSGSVNCSPMLLKFPEIVVNPGDLIYKPIHRDGDLDYVIITSKALKSSFEKLADWKNMKGVRTEIVSVEDINNEYPYATTQENIKFFLYEMYTLRGLKYAMLGGDDAVVPVQYCYNKVQYPNIQLSTETDEMPTDLYYACFDGEYSWNANSNKFLGECSDSVNMMPNFFLTRLPVRTPDDVEAYTEKLLAYEQCHNVSLYNDEFLMCGNKLRDQGDAEQKGDNLYENYIKPYWKGERKKFYDTNSSDFGGNYVVNGKNLQLLLERGYSYIEVISHGYPKEWLFGEDCSYDYKMASSLLNKGYTIITTSACLTNAFDSADIVYKHEPCLSEAFVRNRNSGVIAYLGCSREGWFSNFNGISNLGVSMQYESQYYKNLFSPRFKDKNFGKIVAFSKADMIGYCMDDNKFRWVQFGLNPVGDPEMPVYTSTPEKLRAKVFIYKDKISVNAEVDSCRICVMSTSDKGMSYYNVINDVKSATFDTLIDSLTVCITKQNYIPKIVTCDIRPVSDKYAIVAGMDEFIDFNPNHTIGEVSIDYHVASLSSTAKAVVSTSTGDIQGTYSLEQGIGTLNLDKSTLPKDIISVSLIVDGKLKDSIRFNNK